MVELMQLFMWAEATTLTERDEDGTFVPCPLDQFRAAIGAANARIRELERVAATPEQHGGSEA